MAAGAGEVEVAASLQVAVDMRKTFRLVLEGKASNGGFAIDQLTFNPGDCPSRNAFTFSSDFFPPRPSRGRHSQQHPAGLNSSHPV